MKKSSWLLTAIGSVLVVTVPAKPTSANNKFISIEKALKKGAVNMDIRGRGGFSGNCLTLAIVNTTGDSGYYWVEAGRRLHSNDTSTQDILVTKDIYIPIAKNQEKHYVIFGFCCNEHRHGPGLTSSYTVGTMANLKLVKLARYLSKHANFKVGLMQDAVWVISDNMPIDEIKDLASDRDKASADSLTNEVASIKSMGGPVKHKRTPHRRTDSDNSEYVEYKRSSTICNIAYEIN